MKYKNFIWIIILMIGLLNVASLRSILELNQFALNVNQNLIGTANEVIFQEQNKINSCHSNWLQHVLSISKNESSNNNSLNEKLMACSFIHMRMLSNFFPTNDSLSQLAIEIYPEYTYPYYWFAQSKDQMFSVNTKPIFEKILAIDPNDGFAWRYLGIILIQEGKIPEAIEAHINSCNYGDPGSNGCYNAGRMLEKEGEYQDAIYYYRLSKWQPSQEEADRLEAQLASGELIP